MLNLMSLYSTLRAHKAIVAMYTDTHRHTQTSHLASNNPARYGGRGRGLPSNVKPPAFEVHTVVALLEVWRRATARIADHSKIDRERASESEWCACRRQHVYSKARARAMCLYGCVCLDCCSHKRVCTCNQSECTRKCARAPRNDDIFPAGY